MALGWCFIHSTALTSKVVFDELLRPLVVRGVVKVDPVTRGVVDLGHRVVGGYLGYLDVTVAALGCGLFCGRR